MRYPAYRAKGIMRNMQRQNMEYQWFNQGWYKITIQNEGYVSEHWFKVGDDFDARNDWGDEVVATYFKEKPE